MKDIRKIVKYLFLMVLVVCLTVVCVRYSDGVKKSKSITEATLAEKLKPIAELSSYEYEYTTMGKYESFTDFYGWKVPFTTSKFIVVYDGVIKAGFNFEDLKIKVEDKNIEIIIPQIQITSHEIKFDSLEVYDEQKSIFNPISITDFNSFYADNSKTMENKVIASGLFGKAKINAISIIENFVTTLVGDEYTVTIK